VLLTGLACRRVGRDGVMGAARLNSAALRLLSEPAARVCRQLECLHGVEDCLLRVVAGKPERRGSATFMWAPDPTLRPPCVGPACRRQKLLVRASSRRRRLPVRASCRRRGENSSCEVETTRARRRLLVRDGNLSCEMETSRVGRKLVVRGGD
jgi:hypothetical protein